MGQSKAAGISLGWAAAAALALAACGNVVIEGSPGAGGAPGTTGSTGGDSPTTTSSTYTTTTSVSTSITTSASTSSPIGSGGPSSTGSGGSCVAGCDDAIMSGTMPCYGIGFAYYGALVASACTCPECTTNLCAFQIPSASCLACVQGKFPTDLQNCIEH